MSLSKEYPSIDSAEFAITTHFAKQKRKVQVTCSKLGDVHIKKYFCESIAEAKAIGGPVKDTSRSDRCAKNRRNR